MSQTPDLEHARTLLARANHICIVTHVNPDGDAIGSLLGLMWALHAQGKRVTPVCVDPAPDAFTFLPGSQQIVQNAPTDSDVLVAVDAASLDRVGELTFASLTSPHINIDHHISNTKFAQINLIDPTAAATAEILYELLPALGLALDEQVATCLLTGLVSDTLGFSTESTTPKTLSTAQALVEAGAPLTPIYAQALNQRSFAALKLWGEAFGAMQREDGMVWTQLTLAAKARSGYTGTGDADVINLLKTVRDIDVALIFVERPEGDVKISWRSLTGLDVSVIATGFGGGGHAAAAGALLENTTLTDAKVQVLPHTHEALKRHQDQSSADRNLAE